MKQVIPSVASVTEADIRNIVRVIVDAIEPDRIVLFGSRATGDSHRESDLDLLVIRSEPFDTTASRRKEMGRLWRLLAFIPIPKDILIYTWDEVDYWKDSVNHVVARALREGRVLYERSTARTGHHGDGFEGLEGVARDDRHADL